MRSTGVLDPAVVQARIAEQIADFDGLMWGEVPTAREVQELRVLAQIFDIDPTNVPAAHLWRRLRPLVAESLGRH